MREERERRGHPLKLISSLGPYALPPPCCHYRQTHMSRFVTAHALLIKPAEHATHHQNSSTVLKVKTGRSVCPNLDVVCFCWGLSNHRVHEFSRGCFSSMLGAVVVAVLSSVAMIGNKNLSITVYDCWQLSMDALDGIYQSLTEERNIKILR